MLCVWRYFCEKIIMRERAIKLRSAYFCTQSIPKVVRVKISSLFRRMVDKSGIDLIENVMNSLFLNH